MRNPLKKSSSFLLAFRNSAGVGMSPSRPDQKRGFIARLGLAIVPAEPPVLSTHVFLFFNMQLR
ncbi:hypothetical protein RGW67_25275 [Bacillus mycoides]|uniref:hypothetical protein n=1 Tax=Bacillus mycoides TaxID=1405 RepID=UPI0028533F49|nr:hypothetical protein [Bacillus mycoides]MDR4904240.1 hypothetical protein [Bacillus mycoides]